MDMGYEMMEWPDLKRSQKDQTSVFVFCSLHVTNADERVDSYGDMVKLIHQRFEDPGKMMEAYFDFESQLKRRRVYVFFKDRQVIGYCLKPKYFRSWKKTTRTTIETGQSRRSFQSSNPTGREDEARWK